MIDPVSALAMVTTAFNGVKRAVEIGREVQDVYSQLSQWADAASDLQECIRQQENKRLGLFEKIGFSKSETSEAFDTFIAKQKIHSMEKEIYQMFLYGNLQIRRSIKEKREKMIYEQMRRRKAFFDAVINYGLATIVIVICILILAWISIIVYDVGMQTNS
jgi:hypothetical protein